MLVQAHFYSRIISRDSRTSWIINSVYHNIFSRACQINMEITESRLFDPQWAICFNGYLVFHKTVNALDPEQA